MRQPLYPFFPISFDKYNWLLKKIHSARRYNLKAPISCRAVGWRYSMGAIIQASFHLLSCQTRILESPVSQIRKMNLEKPD